MSRSARKLVIWIAIIGSLVFLWELVKAGGQPVREISYSEFLSQIEAGKVRSVTIVGNQAKNTFRDGQAFVVIIPPRQDALVELLHRQNVEIWFKDVQASNWPYWFFNLIPLAIFGTLLYLMMKQLKEIRMREANRAESPEPARDVRTTGPQG